MSDQLHSHYPTNPKYHEFKSMPKYARILVEAHFKNMDQCTTFLVGFCGRLVKSIFCYDNGWIDLDVFTTVFPSVRTISMMTSINVEKRLSTILASIYSSLSTLLTKSDNTFQLQKIKIMIKNENDHKKLQNIVSSYQWKYKKCSWMLSVDKERHDKYIVIKSVCNGSSEIGLRQYAQRSNAQK
eukprot:154396_1